MTCEEEMALRIATQERWNVSAWALLQTSHLPTPSALRRRIYVHDIPSRWNADVDRPVTMKHGVYLKAERVMHELLQSSDAVTHRWTTLASFSSPFTLRCWRPTALVNAALPASESWMRRSGTCTIQRHRCGQRACVITYSSSLSTVGAAVWMM